MGETCNVCKGTGEYVGFVVTEPCKTCDGTGVADAIGVDYKAELVEPKTFLPCLRCVSCFTVGPEEVCAKCGGRAERVPDDEDAFPRFRSAISLPDTRSLKECCDTLKKDPRFDARSKESATSELNMWLGSLNRAWLQGAASLGSDRLGLRLSPSFVQRLTEEFNVDGGRQPIEISTYVYYGVKFQILPHVREDWDPEVVIRLQK